MAVDAVAPIRDTARPVQRAPGALAATTASKDSREPHVHEAPRRLVMSRRRRRMG